MLVIISECLDDLLISFELATMVFHGVEDEDALGDVIVLVGGEPVREDRIRRLTLVMLLKFLNFDT